MDGAHGDADEVGDEKLGALHDGGRHVRIAQGGRVLGQPPRDVLADVLSHVRLHLCCELAMHVSLRPQQLHGLQDGDADHQLKQRQARHLREVAHVPDLEREHRERPSLGRVE